MHSTSQTQTLNLVPTKSLRKLAYSQILNH